MQSICGRMEIYPTDYKMTHGSNANEILISQSENFSLLPVYSPCRDDNQFFDGWGGWKEDQCFINYNHKFDQQKCQPKWLQINNILQ